MMLTGQRDYTSIRVSRKVLTSVNFKLV